MQHRSWHTFTLLWGEGCTRWSSKVSTNLTIYLGLYWWDWNGSLFSCVLFVKLFNMVNMENTSHICINWADSCEDLVCFWWLVLFIFSVHKFDLMAWYSPTERKITMCSATCSTFFFSEISLSLAFHWLHYRRILEDNFIFCISESGTQDNFYYSLSVKIL